MKNLILACAILLITALAYANSLRNPFISDDQHIIINNFQPWQSWTLDEFFGRSLFATAPSESSYFRPLTLFTFAVNYSFARGNPAGYRIVNIALHLLVISLIFILLSRLTRRWVAILTALLYALHPVHVQAVSYISSRSDPFYTALALLCLVLWHRGTRAEGVEKSLYLSSALGAFFFGLFAKENIVVLPALIVAMDFIWDGKIAWRDKLKANIVWYLGFALFFLLYILIRVSAGFPLSMEGGREFALNLRILYALRIFTLYLGLIIYPAHLSLFRVVAVPESFFEWQVVVGALLLIGMPLTAWLLRQKYKEIAFGILWYLISIALVLNLTLLNAPMMEHWLYFPLIGLTLAFVSAVQKLAERFGEVRGAALGIIFLTLLLSVRTIIRNAEWGDPLKMYRKDVSFYPGNPRAWSWLADAFKTKGMLNDAIRAYRISLQMNPRQLSTWVALGETLSMAGRDSEAEEILSRAVSIRPKEALYWQLLGIHRVKAGNYQEAIESLNKSVELRASPLAYHALGSAYLRLGKQERAEQSFARASLIYPGQPRFHSGAHIDLGRIFFRQGKRKEAKEEWQLALRFDPPNAEASRLLQILASQ